MPDPVLPLDHLRSRIATAPSGTRLPPERALAAEFGIGRRALREALAVVEAEGLIWRRQGKGTFTGAEPAEGAAQDGLAALLDGADVLTIREARLVIEPALAGFAAIRAEAAERAELRALAGQVGRGGPEVEAALMERIAGVARSPVLKAAFELCRKASLALPPEALSREESEAARTEYRAVAEAIAARDSGAARRTLKQRLRRVLREE